MSTQTPTAEHSAKSQPEIDESGKSLLLWLYGRAREAEQFAGTKQTYGQAQGDSAAKMDWSERLKSLIAMEYGQEAADDIFSQPAAEILEETGEPLDLEELNEGLPEGEKWRAEEPGIAMSLTRSGKRPTLADATEFSRSNKPKIRRMGLFLLANPQYTADRKPLSAAEEKRTVDWALGRKS